MIQRYIHLFLISFPFLQDDLTGQAILDLCFARLNLIETAYFGLRYQDDDNQTVIIFSLYVFILPFDFVCLFYVRKFIYDNSIDSFLIELLSALAGPIEPNLSPVERIEWHAWSVFWCEILCVRSNEADWGNYTVGEILWIPNSAYKNHDESSSYQMRIEIEREKTKISHDCWNCDYT